MYKTGAQIMSLRKTYVAARADSSQLQFKKRTPENVRERVRGRRIFLCLSDSLTVQTTIGNVVSFSLRTTDAKVAERRERAAREQLQNIFDAAERGPQRYDHKQLVALAGDAYRLYVEIFERDPGTPFHWACHKAFSRAALEGRFHNPPPIVPGSIDESETREAVAAFGDGLTAGINALPPAESAEALEKRFGMLADWVLAQHGIELDDKTRQKFLIQVATASIDAGWRLKRAAAGDYTPDPKAARFPAFERRGGSVTLQSLLDGWWTEASAIGRKQSTYVSYAGTINALATFLKHDDANKITDEDIIRFKDHRLASTNSKTGKRISAKTVKDSDLAGLKAIFRWAVSNRKLPSNPAANVTISRGSRQRLRSPGFTDQEAMAILARAVDYRAGDGRESEKTVAAKRWLPWLAAYTGARIGELAQLREQDVFRDQKIWCLRITPEAGTVKTNDARIVPIHPHLVEQGFIDFVNECADGLLFVSKARDGKPVGLKSLLNRMRDWIREAVPDPNVQPFHGWRHRLKTMFRDLRIEQRVADDIQGWAEDKSSNSGGGYGEASLKAKANAIAAIPRYRIRLSSQSKKRGSGSSARRIAVRT
ncbi:tyrosine-type recombinase/integrase [Bradyrhizobium sp. B120]|uniref:tyrosine-type recombinase/integrase n=1 Tax=Bradyrhizobium sp. B120 TaxID=3410088 RepID=UPI003B981D92